MGSVREVGEVGKEEGLVWFFRVGSLGINWISDRYLKRTYSVPFESLKFSLENESGYSVCETVGGKAKRRLALSEIQHM